MTKLICFAHRGASGHEKENTLPAMEKAIALGAEWVELDVYAVEGELVVIHDQRLERTTNGSGYVMEKSLKYLRSLDAGNGQTIPTLREVLDLVDRRVGINVELKGFNTAEPAISLVNDYVKNRGWSYDQFILSSFNHYELVSAKSLQPEIKIGAFVAGIPLGYARFAQELGAYSVHPYLEFLNKPFVKDAHERDLKIFVFTVNHPEDLARVEALGVDGIFTNFPELVT
ncbi:MAG: glycerophosphodiester phosphodiesterase [Deltaproteobacteria bacterium]|nr:glycerophosphodiester phosphodiesterase [Deltaproteobacteria bacterium]